MSAPTIVDSPIADKPLVDPRWRVDEADDSVLMYCDNARYGMAAWVTGRELVAWRPVYDDGKLLCEPRNGRSLDECKRLCEQAMRDAGYKFAEKSEPCSNPACDCGDMRPDDVITLPDCDGIEVLPDGAKQSRLAERCDLLPPRALLAVARVMHEGATKYGDHNWRTIPVASHLNHAYRHVLLMLSGDKSEPHLEHAACRLLMALERHLLDRTATDGQADRPG